MKAKHWLALVLVGALLGAAVGCTGPAQSGQTSLPAPEPAAAETLRLEEIPKYETDLRETLRQIIIEDGSFAPVDGEIAFAFGALHSYSGEALDAFWGPAIGGGAYIIVIEKPSGAAYAYFFGYMDVTEIREVEDGVVRVSSDGSVFGGDSQLRTSNQSALLYYREKRLGPDGFGYSYTSYGLAGAEKIQYAFGDCTVQGQNIIFDFVRTDAESAAGEILTPRVEVEYQWEEDEELLLLAFRDTWGQPDPAFLEDIRAMDGVRGVRVRTLDEPIFRGTQIIIEREGAGYYEFYCRHIDDPVQNFHIRHTTG